MAVPLQTDDVMEQLFESLGGPTQSFDRLSEGESPGLKGWLLKQMDRLGSDETPPNPSSQTSGAGGENDSSAIQAIRSITGPLAAMLTRAVQSRREQEIDKLIRLFEADPDRAMRYAIPIGGMDQAFRGFAWPGTRLMRRLGSYRPGGGGGGGPLDLWSIGPNHQLRLQQRYRDQAAREEAAGRFRRAAYVYAELLGDLTEAAAVLRRGKFYIDAAVLYRDKLNQPSTAAECLALGGQSQEAADLYEKIGQWQAAGKIWTNLGQVDRAAKVFKWAVEHYRSLGQMVSAAQILKEQLNRRPDAIALLTNQWPDGQHPAACMSLAIQWCGEEDDWPRVIDLINLVSNRSTNAEATTGVLAGASRLGPAEVRRLAADRCRLVTARSIAAGIGGHRAAKLLQIMQQTAEADLILAEDVRRYRVAGALPQKRLRHEFEWIDVSPHGENMQCTDAAVSGDRLYLTGFTHDRSENQLSVRVTMHPTDSPTGQILEGAAVRLNRSAGMSLAPRIGRVSQQRRKHEVLLYGCDLDGQQSMINHQRPDDLSIVSANSSIIGATWDDRVSWQLQCTDETWQVKSSTGIQSDLMTALREAVLADPQAATLTADPSGIVPMTSTGGRLILAIDHACVWVDSTGEGLLACLPHRVDRLMASIPGTVPRIAAVGRHGMISVDGGGNVMEVDDSRPYVDAAFFAGGVLAGLDHAGIVTAFRFHQNNRVGKIDEIDSRVSPDAFRLVRLQPNVAGVIDRDGRVVRLRVPKRS